MKAINLILAIKVKFQQIAPFPRTTKLKASGSCYRAGGWLAINMLEYTSCMNYKRKYSRRKVRCFLCTHWRWMGNKKGRLSHRDKKQLQALYV